MNHTKSSSKSILLLSIAAIIWGTTFVAQSSSMDYIGPFTFNCVRTIIGGCVLLPFIPYFSKQTIFSHDNESKKNSDKSLWLGSLLCGFALFFGSSFQQVGIQYTTAGKAGFLTALYIILVPIVGIFFKKKVRIVVWISVGLSLLGLYFLCITESFAIAPSDQFILISAFAYTAHILIVDYFSPKVDSVKMSCYQFLICGILSSVMMFLLEKPQISQIFAARWPILYASVLSCGIAYTFQIVGQRNIDPTIASLIMSMEAVVAVLSGFIILQEVLTIREVFGCVLMFGAIILAQIPANTKKDWKSFVRNLR